MFYFFQVLKGQTHLRRLLIRFGDYSEGEKIKLSHVSKLLKKLLGRHENKLYKDDEDKTGDEGDKVKKKVMFEYSYRELFLWAVLTNK